MTRPFAYPRSRNTSRGAWTMRNTSARAYHRPHQRCPRPPQPRPSNAGHHMLAPKRGRDTPTATTMGSNLDSTIVAAFPHGRLSQGGRVPSPDRSRGTKRCRKSAQFSRSSWISNMPVCPAPAPARAAFISNVPSGLTSRALTLGAALSGRCPSHVAGIELGAKMRINAMR